MNALGVPFGRKHALRAVLSDAEIEARGRLDTAWVKYLHAIMEVQLAESPPKSRPILDQV